MEQVLELLVIVYTDDLKGGMTRPICELNLRVASLVTFSREFSN